MNHQINIQQTIKQIYQEAEQKIKNLQMIYDVKNQTTDAIIQWVDLVFFDADKSQFIQQGRIILEQGKIRLEGEKNLLETLQKGISDRTGKLILPSEGLLFLETAVSAFQNPYLQATSIQQGSELTEFISPQWTEIE
ncbi:MAG: hypothetical protein UU48_C0001G0006 [Candidatus Uhrbacteria bacterium GW2011_GWF2_41_16]|jgi:hypothetical protein|uniref:Uncharacterized protein n=2 Tax=Candidatus Uhriibacteriota TaxID=1752732 RepID=A0A0G0VG96_9BACT|nr:MAG: hypothetical protein UU35_C0022G0010 [Candidatus Uhrbacteria bacterium GW2011_GWC2_41_11]KKR98651.1 MAG: hypothetical protein UU48_C0001G0006 [Candidatus Uhrbacteria bacterium GW2011_GWF2_41_16]HBP00042.1 hypothetical protein [Candidatus Uhrbacteria bacterium]